MMEKLKANRSGIRFVVEGGRLVDTTLVPAYMFDVGIDDDEEMAGGGVYLPDIVVNRLWDSVIVSDYADGRDTYCAAYLFDTGVWIDMGQFSDGAYETVSVTYLWPNNDIADVQLGVMPV